MMEISNIKYPISALRLRSGLMVSIGEPSNTQTKNQKCFKKYFWILVCIFDFCFLTFDFAIAQPVSSTDLINNAKQYDGKTVVYQGEAIGEVMPRGDYAWINVHDGKNAIGVWLPEALSKGILYTGNYKTKGDWIEVMGTFHNACPEHGGDLDIHALALKKIASGRAVQERLNLGKRNLALVLLGILGSVWILHFLKRR